MIRGNMAQINNLKIASPKSVSEAYYDSLARSNMNTLSNASPRSKLT